MKEIKLHGEAYKLGDKVLSIGMDMQCFKAVSISRIFEINEDNFVFAEVGDEDCKVVLPISYLEEFYVYNKANRKKLQDYCDKCYKEWEEAVARQFGR